MINDITLNKINVFYMLGFSTIIVFLSVILSCTAYLLHKTHKKYKEAVSTYHTNQNDSTNIITGLLQKKFLLKHLKKTLNTQKKNKKKLYFFYIDLSSLKNINDTFSPHFKEKTLSEISNRLLYAFDRRSNIIAHAGDDSIAIVVNNLLGKSPENIADEIIYIIGQPFEINGTELCISCSVGICIYPTHATNAEKLMQYSDLASIYSQKIGGSCYSFYHKDMNTDIKKHQMLAAELRKAIDNDELLLYYQPKIDLLTNTVYSGEALIRWQHPSRGILMPQDFLHIVKEAGLSHLIGQWALTAVCKSFEVIKSHGLDNMQLSLNISPCQFERNGFINYVAETIHAFSIKPHQLEFEISQGVVHNLEKSILILQVLSFMGIDISIDDCDYALLAKISSFPINTLKIARNLTSNINTCPEKLAIIEAIISLAKRLNIQVLAKDIERASETDFLINKSCFKVQGFCYSKPLPLYDFCIFAKNFSITNKDGTNIKNQQKK